MQGIRSTPRLPSGCAAPLAFSVPDDIGGLDDPGEAEATLKASGFVFVGYGVVAPEYWDDYKGVDVRGKVLVMLINDPAIPDPKDPAKLDERMRSRAGR